MTILTITLWILTGLYLGHLILIKESEVRDVQLNEAINVYWKAAVLGVLAGLAYILEYCISKKIYLKKKGPKS